MADVAFTCEYCQQSIVASSEMLGEIVDCPNCQQRLMVPESATLVELDSPPPVPEYRQCPFCAETIQCTAVKCKHCGEFLDGRKQAPPQAKIIIREKGRSGCGLIFIIALGVIAAIIIMSMF